MPTVALITGSRSYSCHALAARIVARLKARYGDDLVIRHGDCPTGVDAAFEAAAKAAGVTTERWPADWSKFGRGAGPKRNAAMVAAEPRPAFVLAFRASEQWTPGTLSCVKLALAAGLPVWGVTGDEGEPERLERIEP